MAIRATRCISSARAKTETFVKNDQGEKLVLEIAKPGDIFGEISLIDDGPRTASVSAVTEVELLRLDRAHFEDYVRQYPPAALNCSAWPRAGSARAMK